MPAEWEPHDATWIAWPHNRSDWPDKFEAIPWIYAEIVRHLTRVERVNILVNDEAAEINARQILVRSHILPEKAAEPGKRAGNIRFWHIPTDRVWTRDSGPIFVRRDSRKGNLAPVGATAWRFNAWAKYDDWKLDVAVGAEIAGRLRMPLWQPELRVNSETRRVVLEGGSIDVNGRGTLITTEECLLSEVQQRNRCMSRERLEELFSDYLGIEKVIWLERGIVGDDTHGHVDDITRFVGPSTIVTVTEPNRDDANHIPLRENLDRLKAARNLDGKPFQIIELPMPPPIVFRGQRLPASYANFYIANDLVLVPIFNRANDRKALNVLAEVFPTREVLGIYCGDLIWGLGTLHCMTQQQPRADTR